MVRVCHQPLVSKRKSAKTRPDSLPRRVDGLGLLAAADGRERTTRSMGCPPAEAGRSPPGTQGRASVRSSSPKQAYRLGYFISKQRSRGIRFDGSEPIRASGPSEWSVNRPGEGLQEKASERVAVWGTGGTTVRRWSPCWQRSARGLRFCNRRTIRSSDGRRRKGAAYSIFVNSV
jgi:hypothetical protein